MSASLARSPDNTFDVWTADDEKSVKLLLPRGHDVPSLLATKDWLLVGTQNVPDALASEISAKGYYALRSDRSA